MLISADSHVVEPDLWPIVLRGRGPASDPKERISAQDKDGVSAEVLYPSRATAIWLLDSRQREFCRDYNRWLADFCAYRPERLWGLAMVSPSTVGAVLEVEWARQMGLRGITVPLVPDYIPYCDARYEDFWLSCEEQSMPVCLHINTGRRSRDHRLVPYGVMGHKVEAATVVGDLIAASVLERHPRLNIVIAEAGAAWLELFAQEFDYYQADFSRNHDRGHRMAAQVELPHLPSFYIKRQVYASFITDALAMKLASYCGFGENFLWSSDYGHPQYRVEVSEVPLINADNILYGNAVRLFG